MADRDLKVLNKFFVACLNRSKEITKNIQRLLDSDDDPVVNSFRGEIESVMTSQKTSQVELEILIKMIG